MNTSGALNIFFAAMACLAIGGCQHKSKTPDLILNTYVIKEPFYYVERGTLWLNELTPLPDFIKDKNLEFQKKTGRYDVSYLIPELSFQLKLSDRVFVLTENPKAKTPFPVRFTKAVVTNTLSKNEFSNCLGSSPFSFNLQVKSAKLGAERTTGFLLKKDAAYFPKPQTDLGKEYVDYKSYALEFMRRQYPNALASEALAANYLDKLTVAVRDAEGGIFFISAAPGTKAETSQIHYRHPSRGTFEWVRTTSLRSCDR